MFPCSLECTDDPLEFYQKAKKNFFFAFTGAPGIFPDGTQEYDSPSQYFVPMQSN